ncbi:MAG: hypothetical protein EOL97_09025 [Spirochaetia bacterium]|nr:hypothetical protein [Spirochaetia bacterium]
MSYHGLTNEELIMLNFLMEEKINKFNKFFETKKFIKIKENSKGPYVSTIPLTEAYIEKIKKEDWWILLNSSYQKTNSIIEILKDIDEYKLLIETINK